MNVDPNGTFFVAAMLISIGVALIFEGYQDIKEDGKLFYDANGNIFRQYLGATVSGFFGGLSGGLGSIILFGTVGSVLDSWIAGELTTENFWSTVVVSALSSGLAAGFAFAGKKVVSSLAARNLFSKQAKGVTNSVLNKSLNKIVPGLKIGSNAAKNGLSSIIFKNNSWIGNILADSISSSISGNLLNNWGNSLFTF